jgi:hypothetical protein
LDKCGGLALIVRHFAENAARFYCLLFFPFSGFRLESWLHCSLASVFNNTENDNDANGNVRHYLAEFESTSTPTTLGADRSGFRSGSLSYPGTCFHFRRVVLDHDVKLGISSGWSSRVVLPQGGAENQSSTGQNVMILKSVVGGCLKTLLILAASVPTGAQTKAAERASLPQRGIEKYWMVVDAFADRSIHFAYAKRFVQLHEGALTDRQCQQYSRIADDYADELATVRQAGVSAQSGFWNDLRVYSFRMIGTPGVPIPIHQTSKYWVTTGSKAEDDELRRMVSLNIDEASSQLIRRDRNSPSASTSDCRTAAHESTAKAQR